MYLACWTTDEEDDCRTAVLELTLELAKLLLERRDRLLRIMQEEKGNPELYCLEYFDWRVQYGRTLKNDVLNESLDHEWKQSDQEYPKLNEWNKVSAPTLKVTQDGCLWAAYPKHGTQEFETPRITWGEIEAVARGENPFATLGEKGKENEPEPNQETPDDPA